MNELWWLACPVNSILWALGGTWNRYFRRIGYPLITTCLVGFTLGFSWQLLVLPLLTFFATTLPLTLKGDDVTSSIWNRLWVWVAGYLIAAPVLLLSFNLLLPLWSCVTQGVAVTLSNEKMTAHLMPHKLVESLVGFSVLIPYCLVVSLRIS